MVRNRRMLAMVLTIAMAFCAALPVVQADEGIHIIDNDGFPLNVSIFVSGINLADNCTALVIRQDEELAPTDYVATGDVMMVRTDSGQVLETKYLVVMGDVLGTGFASLAQVTRVASALSGREPLEGLFLRAADFNQSGAVDFSDLLQVMAQFRALSEDEEPQLEEVTVDWYVGAPDTPVPAPVSFVDGHTDIPFVSITDMVDLMNMLVPQLGQDPEIEYELELDDQTMTITRENGAEAILDFQAQTIYFPDFNEFNRLSYAATCLDVLYSPGYDPVTGIELLSRPDGSFEREGLPVALPLGQYDIPMLFVGDDGYLGLQTISDIFLAPFNTELVFNGKDVFLFGGGNPSAYEDAFYSVEPKPRSPELAEYSYNELCLALQMYYGLAPQHNISSFDRFFKQTGLVEDLKSSDAATAANAIGELTQGYFGDLHSGFLHMSPYAGKDVQVQITNESPSFANMRAEIGKYQAAREAAYPDGVPAYEEVGDTAFVTFDHFTGGTTMVDYDEVPDAETADTGGLVMYAHKQITREGSPIKNVVIDLSNNGGGDASAAIFVIAWYLGSSALLSINDTMTEAQATTKYAVDANGDGKIDDQDSISDKNLYCLISPHSFSCGNLVPAAFKGSNSVTLLGKNSGGGACIVQSLSMADGSLFQISGPKRISTLSNGSYYDVDRGVAPDVAITKVDSFYDRELLNDFIHGLVR